MAGAARKLAAVLSMDVVGYSRLMAEDEAATIHTITDYRAEIALLVEQHRGRVVDSPGDNLLAEFPSALEAVSCAVETQRVVTARNAALDPGRRMEFRIGLHLGDVVVEGERIYGDGVNIAARLETLAKPGGICISAAVHEQVESKLPLVYEDLGEQELKNIPHPVRAYRAEIPSEPAPRPRAGPEARARRWIVVGAGVLAATVVATLAWWRLALVPARAPLPTAVAVLPFADMSPAGDQAYFADGMTEELINVLSKIEELRVVARTSAFAFKGKDVDVREVGRQLDVGAVVEGSVRKADHRLRISAQLVRVEDGFHLWSETYDRQLDDVFAVQDEISQAIGAALASRLVEPARSPPTENLEAYELYLTGRHFWNQRTIEGIRKAVEYFERALALDPDYALAHAGLADACVGLSVYDRPDPAILAKAREHAEAALAADGRLAEGYASLGWIERRERNWPAAERAFRRAIALNPGYATAHHWYALYLGGVGRVDEALREIDRAVELDPLSGIINLENGRLHLFAGDLDTAIARLERAVELSPELQWMRTYLAYAYYRAGREEEAFETSLADATPVEVEAALREVYRRSGLPDAARKWIELLAARTGKRCTDSPYYASEALAFAGDAEWALECLEQAVDQGYEVVYVNSPLFRELLGADPRFRALLARMGLDP